MAEKTKAKLKKENTNRSYEINWLSVKRNLLGSSINDGYLYKIMTYLILLVMGFVFVFPLLYMLAISLMSNLDLVDSTVEWIPTSIFTLNYEMTWKALKLPNAYLTTALLAGGSTVAIIISSSLIGYGLARFDFIGKRLVFLFMLFTYIVPKTLFFIPRFEVFLALKVKGTIWTLILPAITGQGEQAALFILIFYQFFKMIPKSLEEAAYLDGAGAFKTFRSISLPMVRPAFIIVGVYAFSLYWNETFLTSFYLEGKVQTVPILLGDLKNTFEQVAQGSGLGAMDGNPNLNFTEGKAFAGTLLSILPLAILYLIVQRWFVESINKTGITGE